MGQIVAKETTKVQDLFKDMAQFRKEYREQNKDQITRQLCRERIEGFRAAAKVARDLALKAPKKSEDEKIKAEHESDAAIFDARVTAWEQQLEDLGERDYIEFPKDPSQEEVILDAFPKAFEMYSELAQLLALITLPDADLLKGWRDQGVHKLLEDRGAKLLEESEPQEIVALAEAATDVIGDQLRPLRAVAQSLWSRWTNQPQEETPQETSTSSAPTSSTDSPAVTDGTSSESSSESPTEPASLSPAA